MLSPRNLLYRFRRRFGNGLRGVLSPCPHGSGGVDLDARFAVVVWWAALIWGAAQRLRQWSAGRSIWLDEALLLENILHRSEAQLFKPLTLFQNAPIVFLESVKECSRIFGTSEAALRLPALICGIVALVLFGVLARRTLLDMPAALATFLFAILMPSVYYSAEVKQYSADEAALLALTLLALGHLQNSQRRIWPLAAVGTVAIFASHAAAFVAASTAVVFAIHALRTRKSIVPWVAVSGIWGGALLLNYFVFLRHGLHDPFLVEFWKSAFLPLPPKSFHDLSWGYDKLAAVFQSPVGFRAMGGLAVALSVVGLINWIRDDCATAFLLVGPVIGALAASAMHKYPFEGRLILFAVPACLLFCARGWWDISQKPTTSTRCVPAVLAVLLLLEPTHVALQTMIHPGGIEELRPVMLTVAEECRRDDVIVVGDPTCYAFDYYHDFRDKAVWNSVRAQIVIAKRGTAIQPLPRGRVWLVMTHCRSEDVELWRSSLVALGLSPQKTIDRVGAQAILFGPSR